MKAKKFLAIALSTLLLVASMAVAVLPTAASTTPTVSAGEYNVVQGEEFDVVINIENNPGIISMAFTVDYDATALKLVAKTAGEDFPEGDFSYSKNLTVKPYKVNWRDDLAEDNHQFTGTFITLTFQVLDDAANGDYPLTFAHKAGDIYDFDEELVTSFVFEDGMVHVGASDPVPVGCTEKHTYDNEYDADCNACGATRTVNVLPATPYVAMGSYNVLPGEEFDVNVLVGNNPGIISMAFTVDYDASVLELVAKTAGEDDFPEGDFSYSKNLTVKPYKINWRDDLAEDNHLFNGTIITLTFRVLDGVEAGATSALTFAYKAGDIYDFDEELVKSFTFFDGNVVVGVVAGGDEECDHTYTYDCDKVCNKCGEETRPEADHVKNNEYACQDGNCTYCGTAIPATEVCTSDAEYACQDGKCEFCGKDMPATAVCTSDAEFACQAGKCEICGKDMPATAECTSDAEFACQDGKCEFCGKDMPAVADHQYDNVCADADCNVCGTVRTSFGSHEFGDDKTCDHCGYVLPELLYRVEGDGVVITGLADKTQTVVVIPETIEGLPVVAIGPNAFLRCAALQSVELPASLKTIGTGAFYGCTALTEIVIPEGVTAIGEYAFQLTGIVTITLPESLTTIGDYAFNNSKAIKNVIYAGDKAAFDAIAIGEVRNDYLLNAAWNLLGCEHQYVAGCAAECSVCGTVRAEVTGHEFAENFICACGEVSSVLKYRVENGEVIITGLTDKTIANVVLPDYVNGMPVVRIDNNAFLRCSALETIVLPANLKTIGISAFYGCTNLTEIVIPEGVTTIEDYALQLTGIETITLPSTLETVGAYAFNNAKALKTVNYNGTAVDREDIAISDARNTYLTNATWNYAG